MSKHILFIVATIYSLSLTNLYSQEINPDFSKPKNYIIGGITVIGANNSTDETVVNYSGLTSGQTIKIPGDKLTSAIKKLYNTKRYGNVDVYVTQLDGDQIYLEFEVTELPLLKDVEYRGVSSFKAKTFKKDTELDKGQRITENLLTSSKNYIKDYYVEKGYLKTDVQIDNKTDTLNGNLKNLVVDIDKKKLVKIKNIRIQGNEQIPDKKVRKFLKKTKRRFWGRFWKRSKYVEDNFKEDKLKLVKEYRHLGYRDARILSDSISWNDDNRTIDLHLTVDEGKKYFYKDILFLGNKTYSNEKLQQILRTKKGDIYDSAELEEKVKGDGSPDSQDISSLYQNTGFLFSQVNLVETKVEQDSITVEIRIREDEKATIKHVTINGNERTNDHVIYRELRTRPGDLYSKENIIRSLRELGQLGYFDAETISPDLKPDYAEKTVDIAYNLTEKGSSQIELQGGYGGGSLIGTLGLSFNNFSIRNLFKKEEYKPLPLGDGQKLALRLQASRFSRSSSISFTEPWLGGKKPRSFSFSLSNTQSFGFPTSLNQFGGIGSNSNFNTEVDKSQQLNIFGATVGIGERLKWPDDYFTLQQSISYQRYNVKNFSSFGSVLGFDNDNGISNNLSYNVTLQRNSAGPSLIFPKYGSTFSISTKFTPPYSLFSDKEYTTNNEKFKWLEYYKVNLKAKWYSELVGKFVLLTSAEVGYLGNYNSKKGEIPFERYFVGGDGLNNGRFDGRETIGLRGYPNGSLSNFISDSSSNSVGFVGATVYDKFSMEVRYPISLKPAASIYALGFLEAGNSYSNFSNFNPFDIKKSAGVGIRIFMPAFGLLGIDFGHGFDNVPGQTGKSGWEPHFIIGQQF